MIELAPPLFPERVFVDPRLRRQADLTPLGGSAARTPLLTGPRCALEHWVGGGTFHEYGFPQLRRLQDEVGVDAALERARAIPAALRYEGKLRDGGMRWSVTYQRLGDHDERGLCSGYSCPEDAAYSACQLIEEHEREQYLLVVPVGLA